MPYTTYLHYHRFFFRPSNLTSFSPICVRLPMCIFLKSFFYRPPNPTSLSNFSELGNFKRFFYRPLNITICFPNSCEAPKVDFFLQFFEHHISFPNFCAPLMGICFCQKDVEVLASKLPPSY
jgi:hypothetical protein